MSVAITYRERTTETIRFLREEFGVNASLTRTDQYVCAWTPYMGGPTVFLTANDAARIPA